MTDPGEPTTTPGSGERRHRAFAPVIAVAVAVVLVVGAAAIVRHEDGRASSDPRSATVAYYGALAAHQAPKAFALLCATRQQEMGLASYSHSYAADVSTGTGIHSWAPGTATVQGANAAVPGTLVLDDKESVPITILVVHESGTWRVCTSDLGGVLPNPGGPTPGTGGVTT